MGYGVPCQKLHYHHFRNSTALRPLKAFQHDFPDVSCDRCECHKREFRIRDPGGALFSAPTTRSIPSSCMETLPEDTGDLSYPSERVDPSEEVSAQRATHTLSRENCRFVRFPLCLSYVASLLFITYINSITKIADPQAQSGKVTYPPRVIIMIIVSIQSCASCLLMTKSEVYSEIKLTYATRCIIDIATRMWRHIRPLHLMAGIHGTHPSQVAGAWCPMGGSSAVRTA